MSIKWTKTKSATRGLQVNSGALKWIALPSDKKRHVCLSQKVSKITQSNNNVKIRQMGRSVRGVYQVEITPKSSGETTLSVAGGADLKVVVYPRRTIKIAFRNVLNNPSGSSNDWKTKIQEADVRRMLKVANKIFSWQGNIGFQSVGSVKTIQKEITGKQNPRQFNDDIAANVNLTVFFVDDYFNKKTNTNSHAVSWRKLLLMEPSINSRIIDLVFCHELGHFLGLGHPTGTPHKNLMNQTRKARKAYGGRSMSGSFLTRSQIETIARPCKWKNLRKIFKCT